MPPSALIAAQQAGNDVTQTGWDVFIDIASQVTVLLALAGAVAWLLRPRIKELFRDTSETRKQISDTNEGTHLRDMLTRVETKLDRSNRRLDDVDADLRAHIRHHPPRREGS